MDADTTRTKGSHEDIINKLYEVKDKEIFNKIKEKFESPVAEKFFKKKKILKLLEQHKSGKVDCYKKVWNIYTFLVWYEQFFEV